MPYINSDGSVQESRTWFRFSLVTDIFWGIANTVALFIQTLIDPKSPVPKGKFVTSSGQVNNRSVPKSGSNKPSEVKRANIHTLPKNCSSGG